jgi:hypothetical protein
MEEQLLATKGTDERGGGGEESSVLTEVKKQLYLAGPLVVGFLLQNMVQMVSVMFVGHLGELALASASLATSFAGVTGFSLLVNISRQLILSFLCILVPHRTPALLARQAWRAASTRCAGRPTARGSTTSSASSSSERCWCWPW